MSGHELHLLIEPTLGLQLTLHCLHNDENDLRWFGDYDEYGELIHDTPTPGCWAQEWASAVDIECEALDGDWPEHPHFPLPVDCIFDGSGFVVLHGAAS